MRESFCILIAIERKRRGLVCTLQYTLLRDSVFIPRDSELTGSFVSIAQSR